MYDNFDNETIEVIGEAKRIALDARARSVDMTVVLLALFSKKKPLICKQ